MSRGNGPRNPRSTAGAWNGVFRENPLFVLLLGLCPAAAMSARVIDAIWISFGVFAVLVPSSACVSLLSADRSRNPRSTAGAWSPVAVEPSPRRAWFGILLISSSFTACFEILLLAFAPGAGARLGIYAPLIAVNCMILCRLELYKRIPDVGLCVRDAVGLASGFTAGMLGISLVRETLGSGTITVFPVGAFGGTLEIPGLAGLAARVLEYPVGGLLMLGYLAALWRLVSRGGVPRPKAGSPPDTALPRYSADSVTGASDA